MANKQKMALTRNQRNANKLEIFYYLPIKCAPPPTPPNPPQKEKKSETTKCLWVFEL